MSSENITRNLLAQAVKLFKHNRQGSYKTRQRYFEALKRFCRFLAEQYRLERLSNIAPKHIIAYVTGMQERNLSASHIKTELSAIRFFHDQMPNPRHRLPANEILNLERRVFGQVDRTWSQAEFNRMIGICWKHEREDYLAAICIARYSALRIHECFRIDTATAQKALREKAFTIKGKGGKIRTVPIQETIEIELKKMLAVTPRGHKLFVPDGVPTDRAIHRLQRFIADHRAEVQDADSDRPLSYHGLRHSRAAEWYIGHKAKGYTDFQARKHVSLLLGHGRDAVTRIYLVSLKKDSDGHV